MNEVWKKLLRSAGWIAAAVVAGMALLLAVGFPTDESGTWVQWIAAGFHIPGIAVLTQFGLCCGFGNALVISDAITGPVHRPTMIGVPILLVANWAALMIAFGLGVSAWQLFQRKVRHGV